MSVPGLQNLIAGDMQAGYFGTVPASELWTGTQLSSEVGISTGTVQFDTVDWLKFAYEGKILFRPMKAIRRGISWDSLNAAGCVFGTKTIEKGRLVYKVRLMRGSLADPAPFDDPDKGAKGSEWNKLMLPIHEKAADKSWQYPLHVEDDIPDWGIGFTNADLNSVPTIDTGSSVWCQETLSTDSTRRLLRGETDISHAQAIGSTAGSSRYGWAPVLELVSIPPEISGTDESLGERTDVFDYPYTVTAFDEDISNITEKVNGIIVDSFDDPTVLSRKLTIDKEFLKSLEYFQTHTLEIIVTDALGLSTTRTLTFTKVTKLLSEDASLIDAAEGVADLVPYLNSVKNLIGTAVKDKGGTVPSDPKWTDISTSIENIPEVKYAEGTAISSSDVSSFQYIGLSTPIGIRSVTVPWEDIGFVPSIIIINDMSATSNRSTVYVYGSEYYPSTVVTLDHTTSTLSSGSRKLKGDALSAYVDENGFKLPFTHPDVTVKWRAWG